MNGLVIDNCLVFKLKNDGLCIRPISLAKKMNPNFNEDYYPKITYGSRVKDAEILRKLSDAELEYDDLMPN